MTELAADWADRFAIRHDDDDDLIEDTWGSGDNDDDEDYPIDDGVSETGSCPNCDRQVYEDSERCSYCGHYITEEDTLRDPADDDRPRRNASPLWVAIGILLALLAVVVWVIGTPR